MFGFIYLFVPAIISAKPCITLFHITILFCSLTKTFIKPVMTLAEKYTDFFFSIKQ